MSTPSDDHYDQYNETTETIKLTKFSKQELLNMHRQKAKRTKQLQKFMEWWIARHNEDCDLFPLEMPEAVWIEHFAKWTKK